MSATMQTLDREAMDALVARARREIDSGLLQELPQGIHFSLHGAMADLHIHEEEHVIGVGQVAIVLKRVVGHARRPATQRGYLMRGEGCTCASISTA